MTRVKVLNKHQANKLKGQTKGEKLKEVTPLDIHKAALADPDAQPLTAYQLTLARPFLFLRRKLGL
jgi:hypothetical protein